jgi:carboxypeptidase Taq
MGITMTNANNLEAVSGSEKGYSELKSYFSNINTMFSVRNVLAIDMMTAMPVGAAQQRLHDIASITKRIYAETTSPSVTSLLGEVEKTVDGLAPWDQKNVAEMRRIHAHLAALPPNMYVATVRAVNDGRRHHRYALKTQNWNEASVYLGQVVDLYRKIAELKQKTFDAASPYEGLLLGYGSDISEEQLDGLYQKLANPLKILRDRIIEKQGGTEGYPADIPGLPQDRQAQISRLITERLGVDFKRGTMALTNGTPYAGGTRDDVRLLIRVASSDDHYAYLKDALYQGARALYIQNLPEDWKLQPVGQHLGTFMMNAISLLFESVIGRMPELFDSVMPNASAEEKAYFKAVRRTVRTSVMRNQADEVSKISHDLMRYGIERDLISGKLEVKDLPDRWAAESKAFLGVEPKNIAEGALQNPDWFTGRFGFIPTNTLSHIAAVSLFDTIEAKHPEVKAYIQKGELGNIGAWLSEHIFIKGRSVGAVELIEQLTGKALDENALISHFESRYIDGVR